jgi:hypothetical protein
LFTWFYFISSIGFGTAVDPAPTQAHGTELQADPVSDSGMTPTSHVCIDSVQTPRVVHHSSMSVRPSMIADCGDSLGCNLASIGGSCPLFGGASTPASVSETAPPLVFVPAPAALPESSLASVPSSAPHTRLQAGIQKPKIYSDGKICSRNLSICEEPSDLYTAMVDPNWKVAMDTEYSTLVHNQMWHLVPPSSNGNIIYCKWVFEIKRKADGPIDRVTLY